MAYVPMYDSFYVDSHGFYSVVLYKYIDNDHDREFIKRHYNLCSEHRGFLSYYISVAHMSNW